MAEARLRAEINAEREVDLGTLWRRLRARWWLVAAGFVLGAVVGVVVATGRGQTWEAKTLLYLGQPFTTSGGGQIQSLATNPATAAEIVRSEFALRRASVASGIPVSHLRGHVNAIPAGAAATGSARVTSPLVLVTVQGSNKHRVERAGTVLANAVVSSASTYVDQKIKLLQSQVGSGQAELGSIDARVASYNRQLRELGANRNVSATDKLVALSTLNALVGFAEQRRGTVQQEVYQNQQLLSLAENVERTRIVQLAAAAQVTATSRRNAAIVGALVGLILGAIAAFIAPLITHEHRVPRT
jgi:uncharacterized protein involved in exopolysaccharide biosynthesis